MRDSAPGNRKCRFSLVLEIKGDYKPPRKELTQMQAVKGYVENGQFHPLGAVARLPIRLKAILTILDEPAEISNFESELEFWRGIKVNKSRRKTVGNRLFFRLLKNMVLKLAWNNLPQYLIFSNPREVRVAGVQLFMH